MAGASFNENFDLSDYFTLIDILKKIYFARCIACEFALRETKTLWRVGYMPNKPVASVEYA